jgi:hypothetical protein
MMSDQKQENVITETFEAKFLGELRTSMREFLEKWAEAPHSGSVGSPKYIDGIWKVDATRFSK